MSLREIWPHEALDFTPWLHENIGALGEALGIDLEVEQREAPVGGFSLDLLARDLGRDRTVIIENQLEPTDHTHLGQLITYAAGYDAGAVIWVTRSVREEHRQALDWLNQHTSDDLEFFAVVVEVLKIDNSKPAYYFKPVVFPNDWRKSKLSSKGSSSGPTERGNRYQLFFQEVIDVLREQHKFTNARKAQPQNWYSFSAGINGVQYGLNFSKDGVRVEVYIDNGDETWNQQLFSGIQEHSATLEAKLGKHLSWEPLDARRACRIATYRDGSILDDFDKLEEHKQWGIRTLLDFRAAFEPIVREVLSQQ